MPVQHCPNLKYQAATVLWLLRGCGSAPCCVVCDVVRCSQPEPLHMAGYNLTYILMSYICLDIHHKTDCKIHVVTTRNRALSTYFCTPALVQAMFGIPWASQILPAPPTFPRKTKKQDFNREVSILSCIFWCEWTNVCIQVVSLYLSGIK